MIFIFCEHPRKGFPCGKCRACRLAKANKKMIVSCYAAAVYKKQGQFLTLTFNDKYKPDGLDHSIFSSFMKRLRRRDGTPDVKYFMAGEYGEHGAEDGCTHREHFHVLFYNHKYDMEDINAAWSDPVTGDSFGFTYDGTCTPASMKYVSGYVDKKGYDPESGKRPPYGRSSCNIPDGMSEQEVDRMCRTGKVLFNGRSFSAPELYRRRYKDTWDKYRVVRDKERAEDRDKKLEEIYRITGGDTRKFKAYMDGQQKILKAMMDERDRRLAVKKIHKEKIRLQRKLKRRIM